MACPICKSDHFFVKDPDDEFEIVEFEYKHGEIRFTEDGDEDIGEKREIYCQRCSWHGKKKAL